VLPSRIQQLARLSGTRRTPYFARSSLNASQSQIKEIANRSDENALPANSAPAHARRPPTAPLPSPLEDRAAVRLAALVSAAGYALGISHRELLRHGSAGMYQAASETYL